MAVAAGVDRDDLLGADEPPDRADGWVVFVSREVAIFSPAGQTTITYRMEELGQLAEFGTMRDFVQRRFSPRAVTQAMLASRPPGPAARAAATAASPSERPALPRHARRTNKKVLRSADARPFFFNLQA